MKIIGEVWLHTETPYSIGIIAKPMDHDEKKWEAFYSAIIFGEDKELNIKRVIRWGKRISKAQAKGFFPELDIKKYYYL